MNTFIFGHKNPDTDSICASISYADLKNLLGENCEARKLGEIQKETEFVLNKFDIKVPKTLENVKIQVKDLAYTKIIPVKIQDSILHTYREMQKQELKTMAIVDENEYLLGVVTMKDIAMDMIQGDFYKIETSIENILEGLEAYPINISEQKAKISGRVGVVAYYVKSFEEYVDDLQIFIVGDRYDIIETAIKNKVKLIIVTGGFNLPDELVKLAKKHDVNIIGTQKDSYIASKLIQQCNFISTIMGNKSILKFEENDYLEEVKDDIVRSNFRNFPVMSDKGKFLGFVGRKHILSPGRKKVIMVDHNEFAQSAKGIEESEILEIIDHHKIGGINTKMPIRFVNIPVGSTCTIIYEEYRDNNIVPSREMAGLMLSGILSDTLFFKSPTCTKRDREVANKLNEILQIDMEQYFMEMFKAGTSIDGYSEEQILYRDFKDFRIKEYSIAISQIFTLNIEEILLRKKELLEFIKKEKEDKSYSSLIFVVTDIVKEGSYFFYVSEIDFDSVFKNCFDENSIEDGFVPLIVSRKKQIVPMLMSYIEENF